MTISALSVSQLLLASIPAFVLPAISAASWERDDHAPALSQSQPRTGLSTSSLYYLTCFSPYKYPKKDENFMCKGDILTSL